MSRTRVSMGAALVCFLWAFAVLAGQPGIALVYTADQYQELGEKDKDPLAKYRDAIEENGGTVVVISQDFDTEALAASLAQVQGIIIPGGIDVDPKFYGEERHEKLEKTDEALDRIEFAVLDHAKEHELPVLGICRGHQLLNVHYGGSLIQDIPTEFKGTCEVHHRYPKLSKAKKEHPITITNGSRLHSLLGAEHMVVNTFHHQAVKDLAPGFEVTARTEDGLVEAIEQTGERFVLGVQFHPEKLRGKDKRFNAPFERLIAEAARVMKKKAPAAQAAK